MPDPEHTTNPTTTPPPLPPPAPNQPYIEVSALLGGLFRLPLTVFVADSNPEDVVSSAPAFGFFLRHSVTKDQIVFDLGIRRDLESYPPAAQRRIDKLFSPTRVPQTVDEILCKGGVKPAEVKTVMLSHLHWDQYVFSLTSSCNCMSTFELICVGICVQCRRCQTIHQRHFRTRR